MEGILEIEYIFSFDGNDKKAFTLCIDQENLSLQMERSAALPPWTELRNHRCGICPLDDSTERCPIAVNLVDIVKTFGDRLSHEMAHVTVRTDARNYEKFTTLQEGLGSLKGIVMVTSGCPVMETLKPMVRFHLPFATLEETSFRMISMYMIAQYYRRQQGLAADAGLEGLEEVYADVIEINRCFAGRLLEATSHDANVNALVNLDVFAELIPLTAEDMLKDFENCFSSYLK